MKRILRLYPSAWRERYRDEMESILDERPPGPFEMADLLLGALDAHLHRRGLGNPSEHRKGTTMSLRIAGIAAIIGGALWGLTWLIIAADQFFGGGEGNIPIAFLTMLAACVALLVALASLSAFQAREHQRATWLSFVVPAIGAVMVAGGFIGMAVLDGLWAVGMIGLFMFTIGSAIFGAVTYRTGVFARQASAVLAVGGAVSALGFVVVLTVDWNSGAQSVMFVGMAVFSMGWILMSADAIRRDRMPVAGSPTPA